ncbi:hypothetical protein [Parapedobacter sp. 10938]|uniref:hypothetical protein n=1 Tax=Parapedobacter flavus TaxID=3110225 RepID=UPI002DB850A8|nr:hypothetical protein [Parapedobacter sp. 10938]MEC3881296.1 hypothetical protein [Parapedobacter sp. 10938]
MGDFIYEEFKERVKDFGITIGPEDAEGNIEIEYSDTHQTINLGNARTSHLKHGDLDHLDKIVASVHEGLMGVLLPPWEEASPNLFCMLTQPKESGQEDYITEPIADGVVKVFIHHRNGQHAWISHSMLKFWNVSLDAVKGQCNYNMGTLLDDAEIEVMKLPHGVKFAAIQSDLSWLNTAILFTKDFKKKILPKIGWPIYFAIPTREFCYMVNIKHKQSLSVLSYMFDDIYRHEDLHLTREVFSMTDRGIRSVGKF